MQRREFITTTLLALPALAYSPSWLAASSSKAFVIRAGASRFGVPTPFYGVNPNDLKLSSKDTGEELSIFEYQGRERGGPPLHVHPNQDEVFYVSQGDYQFQCGDERFVLQQGDMIFLPRGIPHAFAQLTEAGRMLFFFQPSGKMEDFFRAIGRPDAPATPEEGARAFAAHDMQVVGPPLQYTNR
jgi:quercetin dioxygenase-like cupin family protein